MGTTAGLPVLAYYYNTMAWFQCKVANRSAWATSRRWMGKSLLHTGLEQTFATDSESMIRGFEVHSIFVWLNVHHWEIFPWFAITAWLNGFELSCCPMSWRTNTPTSNRLFRSGVPQCLSQSPAWVCRVPDVRTIAYLPSDHKKVLNQSSFTHPVQAQHAGIHPSHLIHRKNGWRTGPLVKQRWQ